MAGHQVYRRIVTAVQEGRLKEPFSTENFRRACPGLGEGTYNAFLHKHRKGNPGGNTELFVQVQENSFKVIRPFKYGL